MGQNAQVVFYVALGGSNDWSGKLPEANPEWTDGPFATLQQARQAVRELKQAHGELAEPITVMVRGGKYYLAETLVLTPKDSGSRERPITWCAYPGETPVLSGGRRVTGWQTYRGNILEAVLPGSRGGKWKFRQLFYNGKRQTRARFPKADPQDPLYGGWALTEGAAEEGSTTAFKYKPGTFRHHWAKPTEIEVRNYANVGGWNSIVPLKSIDEQKRIITLAHGGWQFDVPGWYMPIAFTENNRFYIENALEELDQPGEWCFDSENGQIYFYPPDVVSRPPDMVFRQADKMPQSSHVVVPALECLVDIRGAAWVTVSGFTFTETTDGDNFHHEGVEGAGAMYPRPGWKYCSDAVHLKDAEFCCIENNRFEEVGGNGIYLEGYNFRNTIRRNEISHAGANGICLLGTRLKHPLINEVTDNHIHHCGVLCKYTAGIFGGMCDGNLISHNCIEYLPHHAINLSNSPFGRNIVEYNQIRYVDQETADSAAINCWMEEPNNKDAQRCGHIIRFNLIMDVYGCEVYEGKVGPARIFPTSGIYLDNYTSNCVVYGNIIVRCTHAGVLIHAGKNNLIENNIIVDCQASIRIQDVVSTMPFWQPMAGFMTCNHILHNISYQSHQPAYIFSFLHNWTDRSVARSDENIYYQVGDGSYAIERLDNVPESDKITSFATWQAQGYDQHSLVADPLFIDAKNDDYRLQPDSPAWKLGFQPIDAARIGIRS